MVGLARELAFSNGFVETARAALKRGAPILCDAKMVASGVTRARYSTSGDSAYRKARDGST
jgi:precorrin-8X/cobalt-precorrin-8 methylmutase